MCIASIHNDSASIYTDLFCCTDEHRYRAACSGINVGVACLCRQSINGVVSAGLLGEEFLGSSCCVTLKLCLIYHTDMRRWIDFAM